MKEEYGLNTVISISVNEKDVEYVKSVLATFGDEAEISVSKIGDEAKKIENSTKIMSKEAVNIANAFSVATGIGLYKIIEWGLKQLKTIVVGAIEDLDDLLEYSQMTDATKREQQFKYGFNSSENAAFDKAKEIVGIQDDEDLWWMNQQQAEEFAKIFNEYSERYEKLYDSGFFRDVQALDYEMSEYVENIKLRFQEFLVDNKDSLKSIADSIMEVFNVVEPLLEPLSEIVSTLVDIIAPAINVIADFLGVITGKNKWLQDNFAEQNQKNMTAYLDNPNFSKPFMISTTEYDALAEYEKLKRSTDKNYDLQKVSTEHPYDVKNQFYLSLENTTQELPQSAGNMTLNEISATYGTADIAYKY